MLSLFSMITAYLATLAPRERGQGLVEYALILVLVSIVVIAILLVLGNEVNNVFNLIADSLGTRPE